MQKICDALQPGTINVFFQRWLSRLPLPLGAADQQAGYWWELSMAQVEVSRTIVFTQPRHARAFFEALVTDNLDLGRPDTIEVVFGRRILTGKQRATQGTVKTKVITRGTEITINVSTQRSTKPADLYAAAYAVRSVDAWICRCSRIPVGAQFDGAIGEGGRAWCAW